MQQPSTPSPARTGSKRTALLSGIIFLLIGIVLVVLAIYSNNIDNAMFQAAVTPVPTGTPTDPNPNAPVTCDNEPMSPYEVCDHILTINGVSTTTHYTYDEQKTYQSEARIEQVANQREQQRMAQDSRQKPFFSLFGCLSIISCLIGLFLAFVGLLFFAGLSRLRKTQPAQPAQDTQS